MKKRDIIILVGLGVVVMIVAWYFLIISPQRDEYSQLQDQRDEQQRLFERDRARIERIGEARSAARQATEDLLKINKLVPVDEQVPSLIIELNQSANQAGIDFVKIEPADPISADGESVVSMELKFEGRFFDINDFLYRVENYARLEGSDVNVSGRFVSVYGLVMEEGNFLEWPYVTATMEINTYMTKPAPDSSTAGRARQDSGGTEESAP